jgi:hypothetical protein
VLLRAIIGLPTAYQASAGLAFLHLALPYGLAALLPASSAAVVRRVHGVGIHPGLLLSLAVFPCCGTCGAAWQVMVHPASKETPRGSPVPLFLGDTYVWREYAAGAGGFDRYYRLVDGSAKVTLELVEVPADTSACGWLTSEMQADAGTAGAEFGAWRIRPTVLGCVAESEAKVARLSDDERAAVHIEARRCSPGLLLVAMMSSDDGTIPGDVASMWDCPSRE